MIILKRDLNLIRNMLLRIEKLNSTKQKNTIESFLDLCADPALISLHIELLIDSNYIETSEPIYCGVIKDFLIYRITSDGYDYLDSIRENSIWERTENMLFKVGGSAALDVVKSVAVSIIKTRLGI